MLPLTFFISFGSSFCSVFGSDLTSVCFRTSFEVLVLASSLFVSIVIHLFLSTNYLQRLKRELTANGLKPFENSFLTAGVAGRR